MTEAGVLIAQDGCPLFWHLPADRSAAHLGDDRTLWDQFWDNRKVIAGFAHSHPGSGMPHPSMTDLTTFAAIEAALGARLTWWITSSDQLIALAWAGPDQYTYSITRLVLEPEWVRELRRVSIQGNTP